MTQGKSGTLTRQALKGHTEFADANFMEVDYRGKWVFGAAVPTLELGKKLRALIETKVAGYEAASHVRTSLDQTRRAPGNRAHIGELSEPWPRAAMPARTPERDPCGAPMRHRNQSMFETEGRNLRSPDCEAPDCQPERQAQDVTERPPTIWLSWVYLMGCRIDVVLHRYEEKV